MKQSELRGLMKQEFNDALDRKIQRYDPILNINSFERALSYAYQLSEPGFWPKLIKYRISHLILKMDDSTEDLRRALKLLSDDEITDFAHLDFVCSMMKIICLNRLTTVFRENHKSEIERTLRRLLALMRNADLNSKSNNLATYPMQSYHFNLIEMAAYFTGVKVFDDELLPEVQKVIHNQRGQKSWRIFFPDGTPEGLYYEQHMAEVEVSELMKESSDASLIVLGENNSCRFYFKGEEIVSLKPEHLEFIAKFIRGRGRATRKELNASPASIGRYKTKINQSLACEIITYVKTQHEYELLETEPIFLLEYV